MIRDENFVFGDEHYISPKGIHSFVTRTMYGKRNKLTPYSVFFVVAGMDRKTPFALSLTLLDRPSSLRFLGTVDIYGTPFTASFVASGIAQYLIRPLMAKVCITFIASVKPSHMF